VEPHDNSKHTLELASSDGVTIDFYFPRNSSLTACARGDESLRDEVLRQLLAA
jgi:hypothetical protein